MQRRLFNGAFGIVAASALAIAALAAPAAAAPAQVTNGCPANGLPHEFFVDSCDFAFFDGSGTFLPRLAVERYKDVITSDGTETETFKGVVGNETGSSVVYDFLNRPSLAGWDGTCFSIVSGRTTEDWQMTISESGNYSLVCHFPAVA